ncbi:hypothetical protein DF196_12640 [Bifidobacterium callitrichidarum]|uniref:Uncharacterized protein n=2 Tax=Bifidobacterium callitrichidarum TaxID=2052941 RepID=A0A2U2MZ24_9BIFI|nr:hypothetical protein DF196_12640 [Bifidobacterium callitrichidarum]
MRYLKRKALGNKLLNTALWLVLLGALCGIVPSAIGVMDLMIIRLWMFAPMAILLIVSVIIAIVGLIIRVSAGKKPASLEKQPAETSEAPDAKEAGTPRRGRRAATTSTKKNTETNTARRSGPKHGRHGRH